MADTETRLRRLPPETETLTIFLETRPRRDVGTSRHRYFETETTTLCREHVMTSLSGEVTNVREKSKVGNRRFVTSLLGMMTMGGLVNNVCICPKALFRRRHFQVSGADLYLSTSSSHILILSYNCTFDTIVVFVVMFIT